TSGSGCRARWPRRRNRTRSPAPRPRPPRTSRASTSTRKRRDSSNISRAIRLRHRCCRSRRQRFQACCPSAALESAPVAKDFLTMIRISTANSYDTGINTLMQRQVDMTNLQNELTTGKRVNQASDDPAAAAQAERALAAQGQIAASQSAVAASQTIMTQTRSEEHTSELQS